MSAAALQACEEALREAETRDDECGREGENGKGAVRDDREKGILAGTLERLA